MKKEWLRKYKKLRKESGKLRSVLEKKRRIFLLWAKKCTKRKLIILRKKVLRAQKTAFSNYLNLKITIQQGLLKFMKKDIFSFGFLRKKKTMVYSLSFLLLLIFGITIIMVIMAGATYAYFSRDISNPNSLINRNNTGTVIYAKDGEKLYETFGAKYRKLLELNEIPPYMQEAVVATEDKDFYKHKGISTKGMARALYVNFKSKEIREGGSSITQQLVKNALLNPRKSYIRKYQEIILALELERKYTKEEIMKMYLNEIYYGEGAWGLEDAAKVYFGKEARDLNLAEVSMLAGLPKSPTTYSPVANPEEAKKRQKYVLDSMVKQGYITEGEANIAYGKKLALIGQKAEIKAPHFVMYVLDEAKKDYGEEMLEKGGMRVQTTLDFKKQNIAEEVLKENLKKFQKQNASNGSLISLDPKSGEILAMAGSVDWGNSDWGKVNIALTDQQPGSSFKPFAYAAALKKGWTAATTVSDSPITFPGNPPYSPKNYDGKYRGNVTIRKALANSLNVPAVKVLQYAGVNETVDFAKESGINTLNEREKYGLSLVLGGGDVKLLDMAAGYGTFADQGIYRKPKAINRVIDKRGKDITKKDPDRERKVIDPAYTFIITDILADDNARKDVFGSNSPLKLSRPAAAKTGTTNDYTDGWTMGYTPNLVAGVWIGNNDNKPMKELPGALGAGYVWHDYMEKALKDLPQENFKKPDNVVEKWIWGNGKLASVNANGAYREYFVAGSEPKGPAIGPPKEENKTKQKDLPKEGTKPNTPPPIPTPQPEPPKEPEKIETPTLPPPKPPPVVTPDPEPPIDRNKQITPN